MTIVTVMMAVIMIFSLRKNLLRFMRFSIPAGGGSVEMKIFSKLPAEFANKGHPPPSFVRVTNVKSAFVEPATL